MDSSTVNNSNNTPTNVNDIDKLVQIDFYKVLNVRRKQDGSVYKTRHDMRKAYEDSNLFYPLSAIWNLDYCWNIVKLHIKNSLYFAVPLTVVASYALNPKARIGSPGKGKPFVYYVSVYILVYSGIAGYFLIDSLANCDYCKPWSSVYSDDNDREKYKEMLKSRIKREQSSYDIQNKKARDKGLKDEEI
jgi:hypothetical protein